MLVNIRTTQEIAEEGNTVAHRRIKIKPIAWVKKDGTISQGKHRYQVTCRSHGKVCFTKTLDGINRAELVRDTHRDDHVARHFEEHPNDTRFFETLNGKPESETRSDSNLAAKTPKQVKTRQTFREITKDVLTQSIAAAAIRVKDKHKGHRH